MDLETFTLTHQSMWQKREGMKGKRQVVSMHNNASGYIIYSHTNASLQRCILPIWRILISHQTESLSLSHNGYDLPLWVALWNMHVGINGKKIQ